LLCYNCMLYLSYHFVCMHVYFVFSLFSGLFSFVASPSVLWYCWLGLLTCKNRLPYNLYCVGGDVKHCTIKSIRSIIFSFIIIMTSMWCIFTHLLSVFMRRDVKVYRLISKNSIEEAMLRCAEKKLKLEMDVTGSNRKGWTSLIDCLWRCSIYALFDQYRST